jgi:hypothetical protein
MNLRIVFPVHSFNWLLPFLAPDSVFSDTLIFTKQKHLSAEAI